VDVDIHGASDHESLKGGCLAMGLRDAEPLRETQVQTKAIWTDDYRPWKTENVKRRESAITVANVRGAEVGEQSNVRESKSLSAVDVDIHGASDHESLKGGCLAMGLRDAEPLRETQVHTNAIWMNDYHPWMAGYVEDWYKYSLYDTTGISEPSPDVFDASTHRDELSLTLFRYDRDRYYLNLFFQMRFFTTKKPDAQLSPGRLLQAWNAFVEAYLNPVSFWARYEKARETFVKYLFIGIKMEVHLQSIKEGLPCGVRQDQDCQFCYSHSKKIPVYARRGDSPKYSMSKELCMLILNLDVRHLDELAQQREEEDNASDFLTDDYMEKVDLLSTKKMAAESQLEIIRIKHDNFLLKRQIKEVNKNYESLKHATSSLEETVKELMRKRRCI
jgi:hypothetical protein